MALKHQLKRKNFLPSLLLAGGFWLAWGGVVWGVAPESFLALAGFYLTLAGAMFITSTLVLGRGRRGAIMTLGLISFLVLRQTKTGSLLNLILVTLFWGGLAIYWERESEPKR